MFSLFSKKPVAAQINGHAITVNPKETLLQAALRQGIDFPYSCRVGACATCKCRLLEGKAKALTEPGYILSEDELDQGYILACQSVPQSDVRVEVNLAQLPPRRTVNGSVIVQEKLTHDITRLRVQLDESLRYKAGQFAEIGLTSLPGIKRSYSFSTPSQPNAEVNFLVRKVHGGVFSSLINDSNVVGQRVTVDGPVGDFWLRADDAPLLFIAGGSGLAPILAMLQDAVATKLSRPATLLFGARDQQDLYALDEIAAISRDWHGSFRFVPVLSSPTADTGWAGARGLVTEKIFAVLEPNARVYLCGPPAMIDSALVELEKHGVAREHVYADRFTTVHDVEFAVA